MTENNTAAELEFRQLDKSIPIEMTFWSTIRFLSFVVQVECCGVIGLLPQSSVDGVGPGEYEPFELTSNGSEPLTDLASRPMRIDNGAIDI